jgi:acyl carrier protein phosphodiesterase
MNYLAHAFLAGPQPASRLGGLLGDFVKGPLDSIARHYPHEVVTGIALHRRIDSYADRHPAFRRSRQRVSALRRRFSGVMVDMFYDHLLARQWSAYCAQPLEAFSADIYALLASNHMLLPARLASYRGIDAIGSALDRMSRYRLRRANPLAGAAEELHAGYAGYQADFRIFFADALAFCEADGPAWPGPCSKLP